MTNSSTAPSPHQEQGNPWRESLEQRLRERMRELIAQVLEEEVEDAFWRRSLLPATLFRSPFHRDRHTEADCSVHRRTDSSFVDLERKRLLA